MVRQFSSAIWRPLRATMIVAILTPMMAKRIPSVAMCTQATSLRVHLSSMVYCARRPGEPLAPPVRKSYLREAFGFRPDAFCFGFLRPLLRCV